MALQSGQSQHGHVSQGRGLTQSLLELLLDTDDMASDTAAVKSLHPNMCIAVHCSILLHPQLPWYHESAHHWELRDQI